MAADEIDVPGPELRQRNRYFTGKFMTAKDFELDPEYFYDLHRRHNRFLHGPGLVTGFAVRPHEDKGCQSQWVKVSAGMAIDERGRDLVSDVEVPLEVPETESVLWVGYRRTATQPIAPVTTALASAPKYEMNRWQDEVFFTWVAEEKQGLVPLARVRRGQPGHPCTVEQFGIGRGRGRVLTRVRKVSWTHGGAGSLDGRQLKVWFTRPLHPERHGISPHTFLVRVDGEKAMLLPLPRSPYWDPEDKAAVFPHVEAGIGEWVHVSLLCDFILDKDGVPVDGNHLGGRLPSGNGTAGGTFESWFQVEGGP
ncbi:MAG: hypothetical protein HOV94_24060 [Saccharothrix sp.]|nr:hypothetical protein [Saccharothrix sp.]